MVTTCKFGANDRSVVCARFFHCPPATPVWCVCCLPAAVFLLQRSHVYAIICKPFKQCVILYHMLLSHFNNLFEFVSIALAFVFALTIHEFAHAWVSDRLGDPTARLMGRLTLNPKAHLDPIGTFMILFASFGWAKPVPFDPFNLKNPRRDTMYISLAGPVSNLLTAILSGLLLRLVLLIPISSSLVGGVVSFLVTLLMMFVILNVNLAIFNLIPIHPFDGFHVVEGLLPERESRQWATLQGLGIFMILLFVFPLFGNTSPVLRFIDPIITSIINLILP